MLAGSRVAEVGKECATPFQLQSRRTSAESQQVCERPPTLESKMTENHLRRPAVEAATGLSRSSLYSMMDREEFPRPIRIGKRAVAWPQSAIEAWLADRPASTGGK
ncbi:helix-turn-helix transcriptional regulator [Sulfitobacter mediterraneus]